MPRVSRNHPPLPPVKKKIPEDFLPCPIRTNIRSLPVEFEIKAYKLGKKRWSYNQCAIAIQHPNGQEIGVLDCVQYGLPSMVNVQPVRLDNGLRVRMSLFIVYDQPEEVELLNGMIEYVWPCISRKACQRSHCEGPVLRTIQRFGKLGRRCGVHGAGVSTSPEGGMKNAKFMFISIDEAGSHVSFQHFRLVIGMYENDTNRLISSTISNPIRVLANNDVPTGAAYITFLLHTDEKWEGWRSSLCPRLPNSIDENQENHNSTTSDSGQANLALSLDNQQSQQPPQKPPATSLASHWPLDDANRQVALAAMGSMPQSNAESFDLFHDLQGLESVESVAAFQAAMLRSTVQQHLIGNGRSARPMCQRSVNNSTLPTSILNSLASSPIENIVPSNTTRNANSVNLSAAPNSEYAAVGQRRARTPGQDGESPVGVKQARQNNISLQAYAGQIPAPRPDQDFSVHSPCATKSDLLSLRSSQSAGTSMAISSPYPTPDSKLRHDALSNAASAAGAFYPVTEPNMYSSSSLSMGTGGLDYSIDGEESNIFDTIAFPLVSLPHDLAPDTANILCVENSQNSPSLRNSSKFDDLHRMECDLTGSILTDSSNLYSNSEKGKSLDCTLVELGQSLGDGVDNNLGPHLDFCSDLSLHETWLDNSFEEANTFAEILSNERLVQ